MANITNALNLDELASKDSPIHNLDGRIKLISAILIIVIAAFSNNLIILTENSTDRFRNFDSAITYHLLDINCNIYNANCL